MCSRSTAGKDIQEELNTLSKQGKWVEMGNIIDDEVLNTFAVVAEPDKVAGELTKRYGDVVSRLSFYAPGQSDAAQWRSVMDQLRAG